MNKELISMLDKLTFHCKFKKEGCKEIKSIYPL